MCLGEARTGMSWRSRRGQVLLVRSWYVVAVLERCVAVRLSSLGLGMAVEAWLRKSSCGPLSFGEAVKARLLVAVKSRPDADRRGGLRLGGHN